METKYVIVPFEVELAKRIQNKGCEGRIVTRDGRKARVVCWDADGRDDYILALLSNENREYPVNFMPNGLMVKDEKTQSDLMLEIPEYMTFTFNDGDVLTCYGEYKWIFVYRKGKYKTGCYATLDVEADFLELNADNHVLEDEDIKELRYATESEKQKLIESLKLSKEPKAKEYLKRFFGIEQKKECEFNPFDKVLTRDSETDKWGVDLFSHMSKDGEFVCIGWSWEQCIPYNEQTAHLLGTTENYE